ncbi:MAG: hypothetical protein JST32_19560 [Bacteroidetes bacterium]|nr:hypothetical protein [Bacteroidota bacterium]
MYETPPFVGNSDWKAAALVCILEILTFYGLVGDYKYFVNKDASILTCQVLWIILTALILVINYFAFVKEDVWTDYFEDFDDWPDKKKIQGGVVCLCVVLAIVLNFGLAIWLLVK